ncbi:MAG TPA: GDSL-type esterase/lipase family protein [Planctomycetota bacterium]|nr:GDSL-type esterase/lipase family protein [Planctomycetota bacterium]
MLRTTLAVLSLSLCPLFAAEGPVLDSMDEASFINPKEKGKVEVVEGKAGKAQQFSFDDACMNVFIYSQKIKGTPEWDKAAGFSFWVKGDGSDKCGGIEFIWNEDYAQRYDCCFPINGTDWQKITIAWRDLINVLPEKSGTYSPLDPAANAPSKLGRLSFGKWWYWRDYGKHSYTIDDFRLEPTIETPKAEKPAGAPLERVLAKLKAGKPVTIVTMGDSLTDFNHWANKKANWPTILQNELKGKFKSEVTIVNPAIGGTQLRQGMVIIPRWIQKTPEPDLVTIAYGYNDFDGGMRGPNFQATYLECIDRVRRFTKGKSDVLVIGTAPAATRWTEMGELSEAAKKAATEKNAGFVDLHAVFHAAGKENKSRLYASAEDQTHLGPPGHELVAKAVLEAIEKGGK